MSTRMRGGFVHVGIQIAWLVQNRAARTARRWRPVGGGSFRVGIRQGFVVLKSCCVKSLALPINGTRRRRRRPRRWLERLRHKTSVSTNPVTTTAAGRWNPYCGGKVNGKPGFHRRIPGATHGDFPFDWGTWICLHTVLFLWILEQLFSHKLWPCYRFRFDRYKFAVCRRFGRC